MFDAVTHPACPAPFSPSALRAALRATVPPGDITRFPCEASFIAHWKSCAAYEPPAAEQAPAYWEQVTQVYLELLVEENRSVMSAKYAAAPVAVLADVKGRLAALETGRTRGAGRTARAALETRLDTVAFLRDYRHGVESDPGAAQNRGAATDRQMIEVDRCGLWAAILALESTPDELGVAQMLRDILPAEERERSGT